MSVLVHIRRMAPGAAWTVQIQAAAAVRVAAASQAVLGADSAVRL